MSEAASEQSARMKCAALLRGFAELADEVEGSGLPISWTVNQALSGLSLFKTTHKEVASDYPPHKTFHDLEEPVPEEDNPNAVFRNGYGRKGHIILLTAPSGVGKSVFVMQLVLSWVRGLPGVAGIEPVRPLRVAIIESEDDADEMAEFRAHFRKAYTRAGWTAKQVEEAEKLVADESPNFVGYRGEAFCNRLRECLAVNKYDVVIVNPLWTYACHDISDNKELGKFLRDQLNPVINDPEHGCLLFVVHHTNKLQTNAKERSESFCTDSAAAAYIGAGGAELVNYSRAVLTLLPFEKASKQVGKMFRLCGAKRGDRLRWKDSKGDATKIRILAHSEDVMFWREPSPEEVTETANGVKSAGTYVRQIVAICERHGVFKSKQKLIDAASAQLGVSPNTAEKYVNGALDAGRISAVRHGQNLEVGTPEQLPTLTERGGES